MPQMRSTIAAPRAGRDAATPPRHRPSAPTAMPVPIPPSDHRITLDDAIDITKRYRDGQHPERWPVMTFHRQAYERIFDQPGSDAIRVYPAQHPDGSLTVVM